MRVLLIHCFYRSSAPSGEDSVYRNEKKLLEDNGVEVITYEKHNDNLNDKNLFSKIKAGSEFIWSQNSYNEILGLIKTHNPDLAHFHNIFPQISTSAYAACRKMKVPVVQTLHNFRYICPSGLLQRKGRPCEKCIDGSLLSSVFHKCYRNSLISTLPMTAMIAFNRFSGTFTNDVNRYIALTEFGKSRFVAGGIPKNKISIKPNFINDIGDIKSSSSDYVIYIGRLTQEKGISTLIEACKKTRHIPLKILGDGELRAQLESTCIKHNLNVEFLGYKNKESVISLLKNSRFLVLPSECYEGFPVTVAEAYACGKPVLGTQIGSLDEIIMENITGRKFLLGSSDALAEKINSMWKDLTGLKEMSVNARSIFLEKYSPEVNFQILSKIYNEAIHDVIRSS